uniref:pyridoxal 5'-phosphate synthase n=1 Tax=Corethrella appendiculata TaxID=1370023 RepID=U5EHA4_9DIPT
MRFSVIRKMSSIDVSALRIKYKEKREVFTEDSILVKNPFHLFKTWFDEACNTPEIIEPNAMCLATASANGFPSARFVLLKSCTEKGFTFFTNYDSRKAKEIAENKKVALAFYWLPLRRSIRIEGTAEKISHSESEEYFHQRPRASQIGALASPQSQPIPSRGYLDEIEKNIVDKLGENEVVPMPNWGGYLVIPHRIEFWQGQTNRLHDRICFKKANNDDVVDNKLLHQGENGWVYERLAP